MQQCSKTSGESAACPLWWQQSASWAGARFRTCKPVPSRAPPWRPRRTSPASTDRGRLGALPQSPGTERRMPGTPSGGMNCRLTTSSPEGPRRRWGLRQPASGRPQWRWGRAGGAPPSRFEDRQGGSSGTSLGSGSGSRSRLWFLEGRHAKDQWTRREGGRRRWEENQRPLWRSSFWPIRSISDLLLLWKAVIYILMDGFLAKFGKYLRKYYMLCSSCYIR